ncbi:family 10 glycosylhydrolase [Paenibacillus sp. GCM10027626]|uniref:family 10 glycosylhydrolase n=1 Tax=Paenibacillus sp. GCM10027626 TaxID=3273411 RepID=UPI0036348AC2
MKFSKWMVRLLMLAMFVSIVVPAAKSETASAAASDIAIFLDGERIESDVSPYVIPKLNTTMVPLRVISVGIGASVNWNQQAKTVMIGNGATQIAMTNGQSYATVNNKQIPLDANVQARNGRIMVPIRFVSQQLGLKVTWNQAEQTISLQSDTMYPPYPTYPTYPPTTGTDGNEPGTGNGNTDNKQGLRAAWVSTVYNIDWPSEGSYNKSAKQQQEFIDLLDDLQGMGLNAVFVQVRPAADALYPSTLVPWSKYLTGTQGKAPDYDPLAFMIEETHRRGMEFHAWFNPFRANLDKKDVLASNHIANLHPEWIVVSNGKSYINPGIPEARQHIIDAIMEVVNGYPVDGVHLDDYFYPSSGAFPDESTYYAYNSAGMTIGDWRRDNINTFVKELGESIHRANPQVRFGISPFGVWRNKGVDPTGSDTKAGMTAYDNTYADVRTWIKQGWIDYINPQIYWSQSFSAANYSTLVDWWAKEVRGTGVDLYIGHAAYKLGTKEAGWQTSQEIINQLNYNKQYPEVKGDVFFSARDLRKNTLGVANALRGYWTGQ